MSVRNGGGDLLRTIYSILNQKGIDLEFIIVNDGSNDNTRETLDLVEREDSRVKILTREGRGLTRSLIEACGLASGDFIARQDACDISLPGRLNSQAWALAKNPLASMCSCHVRFITKEGDTTFVSSSLESEISQNLTGVIHGSVMMRRDSYYRAGGYRKEFYYAQDVDLWSRLVELGRHIVIPDILYQTSLTIDSISSCHSKEQREFHRLILKASQARKTGNDELVWLSKASQYSEKCKSKSINKHNKAAGAYFIGACLAQKNPQLAKEYLKRSLDLNPFHLRARFKLATIK